MGALRDLNILPLIHKHFTKVYLETGLGFGTGLMRACQPEFGFNTLISIELNKELVDISLNFFRHDSRITFFQGLSVAGLKCLLPQIPLKMPIFAFLDAHFLASDVTAPKQVATKHSDGEDNIRLPLWEELKLWKELRIDKGARDVIVCDDIFLYDMKDRYEDNITRLGPGAVPDAQRNYLPKFIELFKETHVSKIITEAQGTLILQPK